MDIRLSNGTCTAIVTTKGAELIDFKDEQGISYIWNGDPAYWIGRNPLLFPIVGNLKDGRIRMDGLDFFMNRHGFARDMEFDIVEQGSDFVVLELRSNEETLKKYPRNFILQVRQTLEADGFTTAFKVVNKDTKIMPFCIGAHTAFNCPLKDGEVFSDYEIVFEKEETVHNILLNGDGYIVGEAEGLMLDHTKVLPLSYEPFARMDTIIFKDLTSKQVAVRHKEKGHGIAMEFSGFPMMAFWTKGKEEAPFICVEPWHGCAAFEQESGKFEDKGACLFLDAGESIELSYRVHRVLQL